MEGEVSLEGGQANSDLKCPIESLNLHHVAFLYAQVSGAED